MKSLLQILLFGMFFIYTSCVTLYKLNAIHSPLLKEKGELKTSASIGLSGCGLYNIHAYLYDKFEWWNTDFQFYSDTSL